MSLRLEDFEMTSIQIGLFFCIYGVMYTFTSLSISFFTDAFDNKVLIVVWMFCCGLVNFFVGPSEFLPDSIVLMWVGQFLNGAFANFFLITWLPVMINVSVNMYPKQKMEVTDTSSGVFTFMLGLGQTIGPIYGSNVTGAIGFRWCADTIAYILLFYSIVYLISYKFIDLIYSKISMNFNSKGGSKTSSTKQLQTYKISNLENTIESMDSSKIINALKNQSLPIHGTIQQMKERLK